MFAGNLEDPTYYIKYKGVYMNTNRKQVNQNLIALLGVILLMLFTPYGYAQDQCNTTLECKILHGDTATDCKNSRSDNSICMCGSTECAVDNPLPEPSNSAAVPGLIQAEDFTDYYDVTAANHGGAYRSTGVDIQTTTDTNGGYNVGWIAANEWLEYSINVLQAGNYTANIRVASNSGVGMYNLAVDGVTVSGTNTVNGTGGWQVWITQTANLGYLTQGEHTLRIAVQAGNFNINWVELLLAGTQQPDMLGVFNKSRDLLLANFDSRPDPDDIHSVAALATMLKDSRFSNVQYHAVSGAYGIQGGDYIEATHLFNLAFGAGNWSNAHTNRDAALTTVYNKVAATLTNGGDIWIQEAGQSDFSADLVRRIKQQLPTINTQVRIHIVQHSNWNQDKTTPADLTYVKNQTDYKKIADGNSTGNGTPGFNSSSSANWNRALNHAQVGAIWQEAKRIADNAIANHQGWQNPNIRDGGMDFSDAVEDCWIFGFNSLTNINSFFDEFL